MPHRNIVTWTTLISSHLKSGSVPKAFEMFNHMRALDERPNEYTFSVLLRACSNRDFWNVGLQIHGLVVRCGLERDKFAGSSLLYMYFKGGNNIRDAWRIFDELWREMLLLGML
jgi:pentatricopeptide repeat protein